MAICPSHKFLCIDSTNSFVPFTPSTFQNSAGIPSGPIALPTFSASIAFVTSLSEFTGPLNPHLHQAPIQFPSLHSEVFHSCHTESQYTSSNLPYLFWFCQQFSCLILYCLTCTVSRFLSRQLSCPTFAYTKSGRTLRSNSSNSLQSFSHHRSLA